MSSRFMLAALAAVLFPLSLLAQACPREMTQHVPAHIDYGPMTACSGIDYKLGNVVISTAQSGCPTFAVYTPPHEIAASTTAETKVSVAAQVPITLITFTCDRSYLIFIPLSSSCIVASTTSIGTLLRLVTVSC